MLHPTYVLVLILAVLSLLVHRRYLDAPRIPQKWVYGTDAVLLVMAVLAVVGYGSGDNFDPSWARVPGFVGLTWLAVLLYLTLGGLLLGVVLLAVRLGGAVRQTNSARARLMVTRVGSSFVASVTAALVPYGLVSAATPQATRTVVSLDRLPHEFDGLRIALVADVHAGPTRGARFVDEVVSLINAQRPAMVLLGGDLIDGTVGLVGETLTPLRDLDAPLGVFAVTGNHEYYSEGADEWVQLWSSLNVQVRENEHVVIERGSASVRLAGITDVTAPEPNEPDLPRALGGSDDLFTVLMAHHPVHVLETSRFDVDPQVPGHTHAGQLWPLRYLVPLQQPSVEGLDRIGRTVLFTTRGAGAWGPPVRVGADPEISILDLTGDDVPAG